MEDASKNPYQPPDSVSLAEMSEALSAQSSVGRPSPWLRRHATPICLVSLAAAISWFVCPELADKLGLLGAMLSLGCFGWLFIRVVKDCAYPDFVMLWTGISVVSYVVTRWSRAKGPILGIAAGVALMFLSAAIRAE